MCSISNLTCPPLQDFAKSKCIPLGEEKALRFPPVWDWSQQFTPKDQALFNNPMYVGKGATCVQNGAVKSFRRTKVSLLALFENANEYNERVLNHPLTG